MSEKFNNILIINVNDSPLVGGIVAAAHAGAALLLIPLSLGLPVKIVFWICLGVSLSYSLRRSPLRMLTVESDDSITAHFADGRGDQPAQVTPHFISEFLLLMSLKIDGRRRWTPLALTRGGVGAESFRRLLARLKFHSRAA